MPKDNSQKENNKELIEMAAEQFARLFWRQWLDRKNNSRKNKKPKPKNSK